MPKTLSAAEVAQRLHIRRATVYAKVRSGSLQPVRGRYPYQFVERDIVTYAQVRAAGEVPTWHGRLTATQALYQYLARRAPRPLGIAELVTVLHQQGIGHTWVSPRQTCAALLGRGRFRRVRRGWYTIEPRLRQGRR